MASPMGILRRAVATAWQPGVQDTRECGSEEEFSQQLADLMLPQGFRVGAAGLKFSPAEITGKVLPMNLNLICLDRPTEDWAAVFTRNAMPGAPVIVGRRRLAEGKPLQAVVVNNKISNVFPAGDGVAASEEVCEGVAKALGLEGGNSAVLPCSTGVIGWRLPVAEMIAAIPAAKDSLEEKAFPFAKGIMTTDRYPKASSVTLPGGARIVGVCKGAGMIEPNMATMLCYLMTDAKLEGGREAMQKMLREAVNGSFNAISVDGDESTSDTTVLLSSSLEPCEEAAFAAGLQELTKDLAAQLVRNGEGTQHVIRVSVTGAEDDAEALHLGRAIVNGPLFKCAVAGNDPNVGRLVGKVGQVLGATGKAHLAEGCVCSIGGETIFEGGKFMLDAEKEKRLSAHLQSAEQDCEAKFPSHNRVVEVGVVLGGGGSGSAVVLGSDFTKEYVAINADYRS